MARFGPFRLYQALQFHYGIVRSRLDDALLAGEKVAQLEDVRVEVLALHHAVLGRRLALFEGLQPALQHVRVFQESNDLLLVK